MKARFLLLLLLTSNSMGSQLHHFDDIKAAALQGKPLRIMIHLIHCAADSSHNQPTFSALNKVGSVFSVVPNELVILEAVIKASFNHFTLNNPRYLGKPVYEFVTYDIQKNDRIQLTNHVLDAHRYSPLIQMTYHCQLDLGAYVYSTDS